MKHFKPFDPKTTDPSVWRTMPEYIIVPHVLTISECDGLVRYAKKKFPNAEGRIGGGGVEEGIRKTDLRWIKHPTLENRIADHLHWVNKQNWNFSLTEAEFFQFGEYDKGSHYAWHSDSSLNDYHKHRKLSFTVLLSDTRTYSGGKFQVFSKLNREGKPMVKTVDKLTAGNMVVFPSSTLHRVTPVTSGIRQSLVGWVWGPKT